MGLGWRRQRHAAPALFHAAADHRDEIAKNGESMVHDVAGLIGLDYVAHATLAIHSEPRAQQASQQTNYHHRLAATESAVRAPVARCNAPTQICTNQPPNAVPDATGRGKRYPQRQNSAGAWVSTKVATPR